MKKKKKNHVLALVVVVAVVVNIIIISGGSWKLQKLFKRAQFGLNSVHYKTLKYEVKKYKRNIIIIIFFIRKASKQVKEKQKWNIT